MLAESTRADTHYAAALNQRMDDLASIGSFGQLTEFLGRHLDNLSAGPYDGPLQSEMCILILLLSSVLLVLALLAARSSPGRVELEAFAVRRRAIESAASTLAFSALAMQLLRLFTNLVSRRRSRE